MDIRKWYIVQLSGIQAEVNTNFGTLITVAKCARININRNETALSNLLDGSNNIKVK